MDALRVDLRLLINSALFLFQVAGARCPRDMTQSREALAMMDGTTVTFSKRQGYVLSRWGIVLTATLFLAAVVATGLLVYKFASCTQYQHGVTCPKDGIQDGTNGTNGMIIPAVPTDAGMLPAAPSSVSPKLDVRLPRAVKPDSYEIKIIPFIYEGNFTFSGKVSVIVNVTETTSNITLHFNDIKIYEDTVTVEEHVPIAGGSHAGKNKTYDGVKRYSIPKVKRSPVILQTGHHLPHFLI
jgi:aminopeptidase N